jgi:hypothetical protein
MDPVAGYYAAGVEKLVSASNSRNLGIEKFHPVEKIDG